MRATRMAGTIETGTIGIEIGCGQMPEKKEKKRSDIVNCPYCGKEHKITLDTDVIECTNCGYEITMGKKVLPLSNNPFA